MTTIEIPSELVAAVQRAAAADGTSVPAMVERALRILIRDRLLRQDAARDPLVSGGARSYGRMQEVFDSYLMEGLGVPRGGH